MKVTVALAWGALGVLIAASPGGDQCSAAAAPRAKIPARAIWIWGKTVREEGAGKVAARLDPARLDTVLLLVKSGGGTTSYPSKRALKSVAGSDTLQEMLDACRPQGIRVHAWFMFHGDQEWVKAHPGDAMYSCGRPQTDSKAPLPSTERICPAAPGYREYLKGVIREVLVGYPVDGIHLDGIRYPTLASCFCPRHRQMAADKKIDFEKVRQAAMKSTHDPAARAHFIALYRQNDPDIRRWVDLRRAEIDTFVREVRQIVRDVRPGAQLSAALMPEGGEEDDAFALCHYAQDYRTVGHTCDFLCPMSYHASYGKPTSWPAEIAARGATRSGRPALAGIQTFDKATAADLGDAIREARRRDVSGFALFRYGAIAPEMWNRLRE